MEVLTSLQKAILNGFAGAFDSREFYLTGGTALAEFYLKHRKILDLDFFTSVEERQSFFNSRRQEITGKLAR